MSTQKHTQGPWKVEVWDYSHASPPRRELIVENGAMLLATVAWDEEKPNPYTVENETARANAALIAAAPELLAALKLSRGNVASLNASHPAIWGEWLKVIDAAISKAEAAQ